MAAGGAAADALALGRRIVLDIRTTLNVVIAPSNHWRGCTYSAIDKSHLADLSTHLICSHVFFCHA
jgi:hypothetical protein